LTIVYKGAKGDRGSSGRPGGPGQKGTAGRPGGPGAKGNFGRPGTAGNPGIDGRPGKSFCNRLNMCEFLGNCYNKYDNYVWNPAKAVIAEQ